MSSLTRPILVVEDNPLNMKLFCDALQSRGYTTIGAYDGSPVVDLARQHRPVLIVMDIRLPTISGITVTQWLKKDPDLKHIPVIAITAFAMKEDEEKIRASGCQAYMSKPISVQAFLALVDQYVRQSE